MSSRLYLDNELGEHERIDRWWNNLDIRLKRRLYSLQSDIEDIEAEQEEIRRLLKEEYNEQQT